MMVLRPGRSGRLVHDPHAYTYRAHSRRARAQLQDVLSGYFQ